jgi:hypothetical protein
MAAHHGVQDPGSGPTAEELMWQQMGPEDDLSASSAAGYARGGWVPGGGYDKPESVTDVMGRKSQMQWRVQLPGQTGEAAAVTACRLTALLELNCPDRQAGSGVHCASLHVCSIHHIITARVLNSSHLQPGGVDVCRRAAARQPDAAPSSSCRRMMPGCCAAAVLSTLAAVLSTAAAVLQARRSGGCWVAAWCRALWCW